MKKNGYTLVELIITMALLALASTVIIVNMQGVESKQNKSLKERRIAEIEQAACSAIRNSNWSKSQCLYGIRM